MLPGPFWVITAMFDVMFYLCLWGRQSITKHRYRMDVFVEFALII